MALVVSLVFAAPAAFRPRTLRPLNLVWHKIGVALHHIVNPVIMALIYFGAVVPMGLIMQWRGRDPLRMKNSPLPATYLLPRQPPLPTESLTKQF
ncbi:hypothetical protein JQ617_09670 [Bradyrhizobium sp. KB893862 SZCCT0404]|uniref:hypothetical protein n=1 Tax=Bradyrhizobium sp. KB893862 SZCCT0404 TaxID=2807672 RepID=UPI001BAC5728|nr:hypothetical protein [Bradyrhizobium sp. KB893862 SZCCT0404]MBR1174222.1 hypothetical protein [Bradyrhizobium sp. KB893862 SZCCT0404]